jgi:hypothetical protein
MSKAIEDLVVLQFIRVLLESGDHNERKIAEYLWKKYEFDK